MTTTEPQKEERDAAKRKWLASLPECIGYDGGCDGGLLGQEHLDNCPMKGHPEISADTTWEAAFEAGRSVGLEQGAVIADEWSCRNAEEWARYKDDVVNSIRARKEQP